MKKIILGLSFDTFLPILASCNFFGRDDIDTSSKSSIDDDSNGSYDRTEGDKETHYISFEVEGSEIAKMVTVPTDTYASLKPFFPKIPKKDGFARSEWEVIDSVYSEKELVITISAYYYKS